MKMAFKSNSYTLVRQIGSAYTRMPAARHRIPDQSPRSPTETAQDAPTHPTAIPQAQSQTLIVRSILCNRTLPNLHETLSSCSEVELACTIPLVLLTLSDHPSSRTDVMRCLTALNERASSGPVLQALWLANNSKLLRNAIEHSVSGPFVPNLDWERNVQVLSRETGQHALINFYNPIEPTKRATLCECFEDSHGRRGVILDHALPTIVKLSNSHDRRVDVACYWLMELLNFIWREANLRAKALGAPCTALSPSVTMHIDIAPTFSPASFVQRQSGAGSTNTELLPTMVGAIVCGFLLGYRSSNQQHVVVKESTGQVFLLCPRKCAKRRRLPRGRRCMSTTQHLTPLRSLVNEDELKTETCHAFDVVTRKGDARVFASLFSHLNNGRLVQARIQQIFERPKTWQKMLTHHLDQTRSRK
eukprot:c17395_g1_i2.p1 GENE.c17395_g1_i2~~c17395_g1_i2.p1  ORF type:complete len:490 (-),score=71.12 c17395_g1_i2:14-1267(-)